MEAAVRYTLLISSLPPLPALFALRETPISRFRLRQRLALLTQQDAATLQNLEGLMDWKRMPLESTDPELVRTVEQLLARLDSAPLQAMVRARFEQYTVVTALRRRLRGASAPARSERWGYGRFLAAIVRNWTEPLFRLEHAFPWIREAHQYLHDHDSLGLERLLLATAWQQLARASEGHYFDFEAVVSYVLRWNLLECWISWDRRTAMARFRGLLESGLGEHQALFH